MKFQQKFTIVYNKTCEIEETQSVCVMNTWFWFRGSELENTGNSLLCRMMEFVPKCPPSCSYLKANFELGSLSLSNNMGKDLILSQFVKCFQNKHICKAWRRLLRSIKQYGDWETGNSSTWESRSIKWRKKFYLNFSSSWTQSLNIRHGSLDSGYLCINHT